MADLLDMIRKSASPARPKQLTPVAKVEALPTSISLYTPEYIAGKLKVDVAKLYDYLCDMGWWYFDVLQQRYLPYQELTACRNPSPERPCEGYFAVRIDEAFGEVVEYGLVSYSGYEFLKEHAKEISCEVKIYGGE